MEGAGGRAYWAGLSHVARREIKAERWRGGSGDDWKKQG